MAAMASPEGASNIEDQGQVPSPGSSSSHPASETAHPSDRHLPELDRGDMNTAGSREPQHAARKLPPVRDGSSDGLRARATSPWSVHFKTQVSEERESLRTPRSSLPPSQGLPKTPRTPKMRQGRRSVVPADNERLRLPLTHKPMPLRVSAQLAVKGPQAAAPRGPRKRSRIASDSVGADYGTPSLPRAWQAVGRMKVRPGGPGAEQLAAEMSRGKQAGARSTTTQKREALLDIEAAERLQMQHVSVLAKDVALDDEPMQRLVRKVCCACEHALHCTTACSPSAKGCERY